MTDDDCEPIELDPEPLDTDMLKIRDSALDALRRRIDVDAGLDAITGVSRTGRATPTATDDADGAAQAQPVRRSVLTTPPVDGEPADDAHAVGPVASARIARALERLGLRYLTESSGNLLALWEPHAVLFALEGPADEILVVRARPYATLPRGWADRAYRVVNEWNHTRRFYKAYVGDPTDRGQLPIYAEMQVPLMAGA